MPVSSKLRPIRLHWSCGINFGRLASCERRRRLLSHVEQQERLLLNTQMLPRCWLRFFCSRFFCIWIFCGWIFLQLNFLRHWIFFRLNFLRCRNFLHVKFLKKLNILIKFVRDRFPICTWCLLSGRMLVIHLTWRWSWAYLAGNLSCRRWFY